MKHEDETNSVRFWCFFLVGGAITLYGLRGLLRALGGITSHEFLKWFVGADLAHDLIVAPAACLVGVLIARLVPASGRAQVRAGVFATAVVIAIAWAPLHAYGRANARGNSSVEPLNYTTAVITVLAVVWILAAGWFAVEAVRRQRRRARIGPGPESRIEPRA